jgi:predicted RecA/RadA family phage recombinase
MLTTILLITAAALALAMMAQGSTFKQDGNILPYTNPSALATIAVDTVIRVSGRIGVALKAFAVSGVESVSFSGVHNLPALSTDTWEAGDLLWWDPTNLVLTRLGLPTLWPAGIAASAKAVTTGVRADVCLNEFGGFPTQWLDKTVFSTAADLTMVAATHSGGAIVVLKDAGTDTTITLPTGVAGMDYLIINGDADGANGCIVDLDGNEIIAGANLTIAATKTAINTKATSRRWDYLHLVCNVAATSWRCVGRRGIWVTS